MRLWLPVFSLLSVFLLPNNESFAASNATDSFQAACLTCHDQVIEKALLKKFIHQPFAHKKCLTCHADAKDSPPAAPQTSSDQQRTKGKIRWFSTAPSASAEHAFLLPANSVPGKILIEAEAPGSKSLLRQSLFVPPASTLEKAENDQTPPLITDIRADVRQGILINAAITWRTDEKTNASLQYGIAGAGQAIEDKNRFVTDHQITLPGLQSGSTYQVAITCRDIFENSTTSPIFTFSTAEISPLPEPLPENQGVISEKIAIKSRLFSIDNDNVLLELTANQPVTMAIGTSAEEPAERRILLKKSGQSAELAEEHIPLTNKKFTSMIICSTCHQGYNQRKSHPVNILPRGKTKLPPEYPTLPDGRISCMSCHMNHAADIEYRLIKSSRKELCLGCHPDKF